MRYLVEFDSNYADEFDVSGTILMDEKEYEAFKEAVRKSFAKIDAANLKAKEDALAKHLEVGNDPVSFVYRPRRSEEKEMYFGSNEALSFSGYDDFMSNISTKAVPEEDAVILEKYYTGSGWTGWYDNFDEDMDWDWAEE